MRKTLSLLLSILLLSCGAISMAQSKAAVQPDERAVPFHAGGPISFIVKLNEPLPKGARLDFRVTPVAVDQEIALGKVDAVSGSDREFKVSGILPDGAVGGQGRISVIYLFLEGTGWTRNTIRANDLLFSVEGNKFSIPTSADVKLDK